MDESDVKLKIILNPTPFKSPDNALCDDVQAHDCVELTELSMREVEALLSRLRQGVAPLALKPWKEADNAVKVVGKADEDNDA